MIASPNELSYFIELSSTLNFSRAAERIGMSQPSLSAAIKRLETSIGVSLFIRNKNGVILTPAGKRLLSHAKDLLQLWHTTKSESLASHHEVQGCLTLGCHPSIALFSLAKFLPKLWVRYPEFEIQFKHDLSRKILEGIVNFSIDVGIVVNPVKHPDLVLYKLQDDEVGFWSADNKNHSTKNTVIICDPDLIQTQWLLKRLKKYSIQPLRMITSNNLEVIAKLTAYGNGMGILPSSVACYTQPTLKSIAKMPVYHDEIYLVYRHEYRQHKAMQVMISAIKKYFNAT